MRRSPSQCKVSMSQVANTISAMFDLAQCKDGTLGDFRHWTDNEGMVHIKACLSPEEAATVLGAVEAAREAAWRAAQHELGGVPGGLGGEEEGSPREESTTPASEAAGPQDREGVPAGTPIAPEASDGPPVNLRDVPAGTPERGATGCDPDDPNGATSLEGWAGKTCPAGRGRARRSAWRAGRGGEVRGKLRPRSCPVQHVLVCTGPSNSGYPSVASWSVPYWASSPRLFTPGPELTLPNSIVQPARPVPARLQYG
jgi:hypothetical protein